MNLAQIITRQHTRLRVSGISEPKIRKAFDVLAQPKKLPKVCRVIYCFEPLEPKPTSKTGAFSVDGARALGEMVQGLFQGALPTVIVLAYPRYTEPAQNAILKVLEESPSWITICLLYTADTTLLSTVESRTVDIIGSSPLGEQTSNARTSQKLTFDQMVRLQKVLAKSAVLPVSWVSDIRKLLK